MAPNEGAEEAGPSDPPEHSPPSKSNQSTAETRISREPVASVTTTRRSDRRQRRLSVTSQAVLPAVVLVAAGATALWGYRAFQDALSTVPSVQRQGEIDVFATQDDAIPLVEAKLVAPDLGRDTTVRRLRLTVWNSSLDPRTRWAVAITSPSSLKSGTEVRKVPDKTCGSSGFDDAVASAATNGLIVVTKGEVNGVPATIVTGGRPDQTKFVAGAVPMCLELPLVTPVAAASSSQYLINVPRLGHAAPPGEDQPVAMSMNDSGHDFGTVQNPSGGYRLTVSGYQVGDLISATRDVDDSGNDNDWTWASKTDLAVQALVARPSMQARQQRQNFIAGVLISVSTALLLWAIEMLVGPDRRSIVRWVFSAPRIRTGGSAGADG